MFDGTATDLLAADALVQCAAARVDAEGRIKPNLINHDQYSATLVKKMRVAVPAGALADDNGKLKWSTEEAWKFVRTRPEWNCDPVTMTPGRPVSFKLDGGVREDIPDKFNQPEHFAAGANDASSDLRTAGMNLCIAQYLRKASPGASSGQTLLLDDAEQRWLLEVIRERTQIAMLHYALLGVVFAKPTSYVSIDKAEQTPPERTIPLLEWWGFSCGGVGCQPENNRLFGMGRDFATAVQLHSVVTEELAQLLARSGSAALPRGGKAETRADETWGPGAWKQRLHALLYGGDPLAIESGGPWAHPLGTWVPAGLSEGDWPDAARVPNFRTEIQEPQVNELLVLARRYDRLKLNVTSPVACLDYDLTASAQLLYDYVEAHLRRDACFVQLPGGGCETAIDNLVPVPGTALEQMLLWRDHRITREHATTLVKHLAELLTFKGNCLPAGMDANDSRFGPLNIDGALSITVAPPVILSIAQDARFVQPPLQESAPKYTRFAGFRIPDPVEILPLADSGKQGFHGCGTVGACPPGGQVTVSQSTEAKRLMGSVSALAAVRRALLGTVDYIASTPTAQKARLNDYFALRGQILGVIGGAIGDESFALRPWVVAANGDTDIAVLTVPVTTSTGSNELRTMWNIEGTIAAEDESFWPDGVWNRVCALENPLAGNLAAYPQTKIGFAPGLDQLIDQAAGAFTCGSARRAPAVEGGPSRWAGFVATRGPNWDLSVNRVAPTFVASHQEGAQFSHRLLGSQFRAWASVQNVRQGQYLATGGTLGTFAVQQNEHRQGNPVEPRYDAFGYPTDWVPPLSAELVGGPAGQDSATYFLGLAKSSSQEATAAVEKAVDDLIKTEQDEVAEAAAAAKAQAGLLEDKQALCGTNPSCDVLLVTRPLDPTWYPNKPVKQVACPTDPKTDAELSKAIDCLVSTVVESYFTMQLKIAKPVSDSIKAPSPPSFAEFSGGSLQQAFIDQWSAIKAPDENFKVLVTTANAAKAQMVVAQAVVNKLQIQQREACGAWGTIKGHASGISVGFPSGVSYSPGGAINQQEKCQNLTLEIGVQKKQVIATQMEALAAIGSAIKGTVDAQTAIVKSSAQVDLLMNQRRLADARYELESKLASQTAATSFGLSRRFRAYDLWRAKALVENSRRYALAARRATEARFVVDLSHLNQPEAFVGSPATWADEVYEYDLSLPGSVGLATGENQPGGIYANKVKDYVTNLESFVSGYAVTRPAAVAKDDIDVLTLPGLSSDSPIFIDTFTGEPCVDPPPSTCVKAYANRGTGRSTARRAIPGESSILAFPRVKHADTCAARVTHRSRTARMSCGSSSRWTLGDG
ncbi:MAG: hypothetical protein IPI67_13280 [Myxococcales bacterium]|nr:hypothetical protein [Myxococcales bacterium]